MRCFLSLSLQPSSFLFRAGGIRTHDLLNPIQAHYQAVLRPDDAATIHRQTSDCQTSFSRWIVSVFVAGVLRLGGSRAPSRDVKSGGKAASNCHRATERSIHPLRNASTSSGNSSL